MLQPEHDDPRKSSFLQRALASSELLQARNGVWHGDMISLLVGVATTIVRNMLLYIKWHKWPYEILDTCDMKFVWSVKLLTYIMPRNLSQKCPYILILTGPCLRTLDVKKLSYFSLTRSRAVLTKIQRDATECSLIYFTAKSLYMFRVSTAPIIRCTKNCNRNSDLAALEGGSCTDIMTCSGGCGYSF
jgi:hypothetical protein